MLTKNQLDKSTDSPVKPEGFGSKNVKTITFLICLGIFLALAGPISVFRIAEYIEDSKIEVSHPMSVENVLAIAEKGKYVTWNELTAYDGETLHFDNETHYQINVNGGKYLLYAVKNDNSGKVEYLTLSRFSDDLTFDLLNDKNITAFLNEE